MIVNSAIVAQHLPKDCDKEPALLIEFDNPRSGELGMPRRIWMAVNFDYVFSSQEGQLREWERVLTRAGVRYAISGNMIVPMAVRFFDVDARVVRVGVRLVDGSPWVVVLGDRGETFQSTMVWRNPTFYRKMEWSEPTTQGNHALPRRNALDRPDPHGLRVAVDAPPHDLRDPVARSGVPGPPGPAPELHPDQPL